MSPRRATSRSIVCQAAVVVCLWAGSSLLAIAQTPAPTSGVSGGRVSLDRVVPAKRKIATERRAGQSGVVATAPSGAEPVVRVASFQGTPAIAGDARTSGGDPQPASQVAQVGFLEDFGRHPGCGPACDCASGHLGEVVCGVEGGYEVSCGLEPICGSEGVMLQEPHCGSEAMILGEPMCGAEGLGDCACDACVNACEVDCFPLFLPILRVNWHRMDFFAGYQAYTGPLNFAATDAANPAVRDGSGSFGFYQGFNEGRSLRRWLGIDLAAQFGLRATQANFSGAEFTEDRRHQIFLTGGFFRRVDYGLQYGVVVDYLNEDWYFQGDLTQLRGELSWMLQRGDSFGFMFTSGFGGDESTTFVRNDAGTAITLTESLAPHDQYRLFYRFCLPSGGGWTAFAGWTEQDHALLGSAMNLNLSRRFGLQTGVTYLLPDGPTGTFEHRQESWNVSIGFVFRPGGMRSGDRYSRPMFDVADNGTFLTRR